MGFEKAPLQPQPADESGEEMTPEELDSEEQIIRNSWEDTLNGKKPASLFSTRWEVTDEDLAKARQKGLDVIRVQEPGKTEDDPPVDVVYVAQPGKFSDLLSDEDMERFRNLGLGDRINKVMAEIDDKSIAEAMVYLHKYPRTDQEYDLGSHNKERPEIGALAGIGFGYPACDVEDFVRVSFFGKKPEGISDPRWGHDLCPDCSKREIERQQQQDGDH